MNKILPFLLLLAFNFSNTFGQSEDSLQQKLDKIHSKDTSIQYDAIEELVDSLRWAEHIEEERRQEILRQERERKEEALRSKELIIEIKLLDSLLGVKDFKEINRLSDERMFREIDIETDSVLKGGLILLDGFKYVDFNKQLNDADLKNINKYYEIAFMMNEDAKSIQLPSINDYRGNLYEYSNSLLKALQYVFTNHSSELKMTFAEYQNLEVKRKISSQPIKVQIKYRHEILKICLNEIKS